MLPDFPDERSSLIGADFLIDVGVPPKGVPQLDKRLFIRILEKLVQRPALHRVLNILDFHIGLFLSLDYIVRPQVHGLVLRKDSEAHWRAKEADEG